MILLALLAGCGESAPIPGGTTAADTDPPTSGLTFERHLFFVGGAAAAPHAAVFDFNVVDHGSRLERTALSWILRDGRWRPLLSSTWAHAPMREPWRLVPYGGLRLVATGEGEVELVYREGGVTTRLVPGSGIAQWTGPRGREILLRDAALTVGPDAVYGTLFDLQLQRPTAGGPHRGPAIFLTNGETLYLVLFADQQGRGSLWLRTEEDDLLYDDFRLEHSGTGGWSIASADGALSADAAVFGEAATVGDGAQVRTLRGTLTLAGRRFTVFGLVRLNPA
jgi:hypothetical protein